MTAVERSPETDSGIVLRAIAVALLFILGYLWLEQHGGLESARAGWLATVGAAVGIGSAVLERILQTRERDRIAVHVRTFLRALLSVEAVAILWAIAGLLILTRSSVEVVGESPEDTGIATIIPIAGVDSTKQSFSSGLKPARFTWLATSPFGKRYGVDVPGYVRGSFIVYPIGGLRLTLGKDLQPSPSALFRPDATVLSYLKSSGGRIRISVRRGSRVDSIAGGQGGTSFLLGRPQAIPADMLQDWQLALGGPNNPTFGETLLAWKHPQYLDVSTRFAPGTVLIAEVFSQGGNVVGKAEVVLRNERLVDVEIAPEQQP
jgi:hypothetical protein